MKILYIAELVGKAGLFCARKSMAALKEETGADALIVCADALTGGGGLGRQHAAYVRKLGADVITLGDQCFYKKDLVEDFAAVPYVLRPLNLNPEAPGQGTRVFTAARGGRFAVAVLLGQSHFNRLHGDNPFSRVRGVLERLRGETPHIIVDFHAQASAEKKTLFALADGLASAVIGSHTRAATADAVVSAAGTASITDAGRTGSVVSVGGYDAAARVTEYLTRIPDWKREAWGGLETQAVLVETDENGRAKSIRHIRKTVPAPPVSS